MKRSGCDKWEIKNVERTFPNEIWWKIFSFLSVGELAQCRSVSIQWKFLSSYPDIWCKHCRFRWGEKAEYSLRKLWDTMSCTDSEWWFHAYLVPHWFDRYKDDDPHQKEIVWREMNSLKHKIFKNNLQLQEADKVAQETMNRVKKNLIYITETLKQNGYSIQNILIPILDVDNEIAQIEEIQKDPIPLSLKYFWKFIGEVCIPRHPHLEQWLGNFDLRDYESDALTVLFPGNNETDEKYFFMAGDSLSKSGVSGGSYNCSWKGGVDAKMIGWFPTWYTKWNCLREGKKWDNSLDPYSEENAEELLEKVRYSVDFSEILSSKFPFMVYLRDNFKWGCFPGLAYPLYVTGSLPEKLVKLLKELKQGLIDI